MAQAHGTKEIANCLNRDSVLEFAVYTIINLHDLYHAAKILINEKALYGVGQSLAISALEELGKLFLSLSYLTNEISADSFARGVYLHERKQNLGKVTAWMTTPIVAAIQEVKKEVEANISIDDFFLNIKDNLSLLEIKLSSVGFISELENMLKENLEERRQNGLYVSITNEGNLNYILHPRQITEAEAKSILNIVATFDDIVNQCVLHGPEFEFNSLDENDVSEQVLVDKLKLFIDEMCKKYEHHLSTT